MNDIEGRKRLGERCEPTDIREQDRKPLLLAGGGWRSSDRPSVSELKIFFVQHQRAQFLHRRRSSFGKLVGYQARNAPGRRALAPDHCAPRSTEGLRQHNSTSRTPCIAATCVRVRDAGPMRCLKNGLNRIAGDCLPLENVKDVWHEVPSELKTRTKRRKPGDSFRRPACKIDYS